MILLVRGVTAAASMQHVSQENYLFKLS